MKTFARPVFAALVAVAVIVSCAAPGAVQTRPPDSLYVSAQNEAFNESRVEASANTGFQLWFDNRDVVPHNVNIADVAGASVARGEVFTGPSGQVLNVPALA